MLKYMMHLEYGRDGEVEMVFNHRADALHAFNELPPILQEKSRTVVEVAVSIRGDGKLEAELGQILAEATH